MRRYLPLLLALLVPVGAWAEDSIDSGRWTAVGTCTGCFASPTNAEDMVIASGHTIYVDGTVTMTTGSVTVASGGKLVVTAGSTLLPGAYLKVQDGGTFEATGAKLGECEIASQPTWTTANPSAPLNCPAATIATTSDYLVFLDEDPAGSTFTRKAVQVGPGRTPGVYKTALNRYAWYDITALSGRTVTWDLDSGTYVASPDAPYAGIRGDARYTTILAPGDLSYTVMAGRQYTRVTILAATTTAAVLINADLGSMYLQYAENIANAADPTYCSGLAAKILHTENDNVGGDQLYVAGDVSRCTNGSAFITPGARLGDRVALIRPATIDGIVGATHTGSIRIETGATVRMQWARATRLGAMLVGDITPNLGRACNFCMYQSSTSPGAGISGYMLDSEISFPEAAVGDTGVLYASAMANSGVDLRYPSSGPIDMTGMTFGRLHIHDARNENAATNGGTHGIYPESANGFLVTGARVERMSDDTTGAQVVPNATGTSTTPTRIEFRQVLAYEGVAEDDTSQQGFEPAPVNVNHVSGVSNYVFNAGAVNATDVVAIGCRGGCIHTTLAGGRFNRIVSGGSFEDNASATRSLNVDAVSAAGPAGNFSTNPFVISNSFLTTLAEDGLSANSAPMLLATVENSIVAGMDQSVSAAEAGAGGQQIGGVLGCSGSYLYHRGDTNGEVINGQAAFVQVGSMNRTYTNCAFVTESANTLGITFHTASTPYTLTMNRVAFLTNTTGFFNSQGPLYMLTQLSTIVANISGFWASNLAPASADTFTSNASWTVSDLCVESNNKAATEYGAYVATTTISTPDLLPNQATNPAIGELVTDPRASATDVCARAKPARLGWSEVGMAQVILGDFVLEQMFPNFTSTRDLVTAVGGTATTTGGGGCSIWPCF